jgi:ElaB/YqjD/DUF883 family membrane-anchored ribosome-binding protein
MAEESGELTGYDRDSETALDAAGDRTEFSSDEGIEETEVIRGRIEETRKEMGETIDAIQERLSLSNISEQVSDTVSNAFETAKDTAYDATIGKAVGFMKDFGDGVTSSNTFRTIKSNPFPFALIGIGAGLLAYQAFAPGRSSRLRNGGRQYGNSQRRLSDDRTSSGVLSRAYDGISERAGSAVETVTDKTHAAYDSVSGALTRAYDGAGDAAHRAYDRAGDAAYRAYDRIGEYGTVAQEKYDEYIEENPLAVGAVAMAVGAAVGFAIPATRYEGRLMGDARDNLLQRTQDAVGSMVDKAKQAASEAGEAIVQTGDDLTRQGH